MKHTGKVKCFAADSNIETYSLEEVGLVVEAIEFNKLYGYCEQLEQQLSDTKAELEAANQRIRESQVQIPDLVVHKNPSGQIYSKDGNGNYWDVSKYVGKKFYIEPIIPPTQQEAIDKAVAPYIEALEHIAGKPILDKVAARNTGLNMRQVKRIAELEHHDREPQEIENVVAEERKQCDKICYETSRNVENKHE